MSREVFSLGGEGRVIRCFPLLFTDEQGVRMPVGAEILGAGMQDGIMCLWALCDAGADMVTRTIGIAADGLPLPVVSGEWRLIEMVQVDMPRPKAFFVFDLLPSVGTER